jgi:hypothetical protein
MGVDAAKLGVLQGEEPGSGVIVRRYVEPFDI